MDGAFPEADASLRNTIRHLTLHAEGGRLEERDGVFLFAGTCDTSHPYVNGVIRTDSRLSAADVVDAARAFFADSGRSFGLWASTHRDGDIRELALAAGWYSHRPEGSPGMMLERDPGPVDRERLDTVESPGTHADFVAVTERAYSHAMTPEVTRAIFGELAVLCGPNVRAFVARDGGATAAAAMVTVYDGLGEVGFVGTVPEARGRGLGLLVSQACAHDAFARDARRVFLQASAMGEPVYRRLGFVEVTRYVKFEVPADRPVGA